MGRAYSPTQVLSIKSKKFDFKGRWFDAFGNPECVGTWFIFGQSGSGKTSFVMQLCKELSRFDKVGYNSLEEGVSLSMQDAIKRFGLVERNGRVLFYDCESMTDLSERLKKPKQPKIVVIDSFQYTQMTYKEYIAFKEAHKDKLIIFISHASGNQPAGRSAVSVMYDASLKIYVQGYRAFSRGRFAGPVGYFDVWEERAKLYWEGKNK